MRAVRQLPASMTSVVDAPRAVSSDASPTRPLCAVKCASMPAARAAVRGNLAIQTVAVKALLQPPRGFNLVGQIRVAVNYH